MAWLAAPALLCLLLALAPDTLQTSLAWQREAIADGDIWRLWTAHFVHFGAAHALAGAVALALIGLAAARANPDAACPEAVLGPAAWLPLVAAPLISLALLQAAPGMGEYRGASALAMSGLAWLATGAARSGSRAARAGLATLIVAVALETLADGLPLSTLPAGVAVAWQAHLLGLAMGIALAFAAPAHARRPAPPAPSEQPRTTPAPPESSR